jgi:hypothetical protein
VYRIFLEQLRNVHSVKIFLAFKEREGSLPVSQKLSVKIHLIQILMSSCFLHQMFVLGGEVLVVTDKKTRTNVFTYGDRIMPTRSVSVKSISPLLVRGKLHFNCIKIKF